MYISGSLFLLVSNVCVDTEAAEGKGGGILGQCEKELGEKRGGEERRGMGDTKVVWQDIPPTPVVAVFS